MSLALARERHGACPRCTPVTWHTGPCPEWGAALERERPVRCRRWGCGARTFRNDGMCSDRCAAPSAVREGGSGVPLPSRPPALSPADRAARNAATAAAVDRLIEATVPGTGASRGTASTGPGSFPRVLR